MSGFADKDHPFKTHIHQHACKASQYKALNIQIKSRELERKLNVQYSVLKNNVHHFVVVAMQPRPEKSHKVRDD